MAEAHPIQGRLDLLMIKSGHLLIVILVGCISGACTSGAQKARVFTSPQQRHMIAPDGYLYRISLDIRSLPLDKFRIDAIRSIGLAFRKSGAKRLTLRIGSGNKNNIVLRDVKNILRDTYVSANQIDVIIIDSKDGMIELSFVNPRINFLSECGQWTRDIYDSEYLLANRPSIEFGCASQANLFNQVANKQDLFTARPMTAADAKSRVNKIVKWRDGLSQKSIN